jgi:hypothetical protein
MEQILEQLQILFFGDPELGLTYGMPLPALAVAGLVQAGGSIIGGLFGASSAKRKERRAAREKRRLESKLNSLEKNSDYKSLRSSRRSFYYDYKSI